MSSELKRLERRNNKCSKRIGEGNYFIRLRLNEEEIDALRRTAKKMGMAASEYLRTAFLEEAIDEILLCEKMKDKVSVGKNVRFLLGEKECTGTVLGIDWGGAVFLEKATVTVGFTWNDEKSFYHGIPLSDVEIIE